MSRCSSAAAEAFVCVNVYVCACVCAHPCLCLPSPARVLAYVRVRAVSCVRYCCLSRRYAEWRAARPKIVEATRPESEAAAGGKAFTNREFKHRGVQRWYLAKAEVKVLEDKKRAKAPSLANRLQRLLNSSKEEAPNENKLKLQRVM